MLLCSSRVVPLPGRHALCKLQLQSHPLTSLASLLAYPEEGGVMLLKMEIYELLQCALWPSIKNTALGCGPYRRAKVNNTSLSIQVERRVVHGCAAR